MKKNLPLKSFLLILLAIVINSTSLFAQEIIFVYASATVDVLTGEPADMQGIRLLEEAGYTVHPWTSLDITTFTDEQLDSLENTDLIYIGRSVQSGNFDPGKKELWNAISTPMMTGAMWALRSTKMNWFETADCSNIDDPVDAVFQGDILEEDEVFEGLSGTIDWWTGPYSTINVSDAGNGQVLARSSDDLYVLFVRFEADTEFYPGSIDEPAGPRTFFGSGSDNLLDADGNKIFNYLGYSEDVMKVFLNEVAIMTGVFEPQVGVKKLDVKLKPSVYPVPTLDNLVVEMDNLKKVDVIDLTGKTVATYTAESKKLSMDVSSLNKGIYFLKISDNKGDTSIRRFTKE
ncbi:MAG: T9SS type A sorting domain-containing protein [Prolixibacteraceae bacterium]